MKQIEVMTTKTRIYNSYTQFLTSTRGYESDGWAVRQVVTDRNMGTVTIIVVYEDNR